MAYLLPTGNLYRNYVTNGNFTFQQRGTGANSTTNVYSLDRWVNNSSGTAGTISQQTTSFAGTQSATCARLATSASGTTAVNLFQPGETAVNSALIGQQVTLSCKVRKSAGLAAGDLVISALTTTTVDDSFGNQVSGTVQLTATLANASLTTSFQILTVTGTIPSTARSICLKIALNNSPTASQYIEVTDIVLNPGAVAAPFSYAAGSIAAELVLCQRYYEAVGAGCTGGWLSATTASLAFRYAVTKRTTPTVSMRLTTPIVAFGSGVGSSTGVASAIAAVGGSDSSGWAGNVNGFSGATVGSVASVLSSNVFAADAEMN